MIFRVLLLLTALALLPVHGIAEPVFDPLLLNIRMSSTALHPPANLVKQRWTLEGYRLGRLGPQAPRAAIIEDDARQRLLILSSTDEGTVLVYRMGDLPVNVAQRLPQALACSRTRHCQNQRNDPAGELGCLAICLLEHLTE
jgi:hypothetical protein